MNKKQWNALSLGLFIFGCGMSYVIPSCLGVSGAILSPDTLLTACYVRRYAYAIPSIIMAGLGIIFFFVGHFETNGREK